METAQLYFPKAKYRSDKNLREIYFGDFEMKTYEQLKENSTYRTWIEEPTVITPPNGENFLAFKKEFLKVFNKLFVKMDNLLSLFTVGLFGLSYPYFLQRLKAFNSLLLPIEQFIH